MLSSRLYRAAFAPFLVALAVAAFSLGSVPQPLTSNLAPEAFEGAPALAELQSLAARFPDRRPGSSADDELAQQVAGTIRGLGGASGGGFSVHIAQVEGQTIEGRRTLSTVIAQRPGSTAASPIVIVAHRDAAASGSAAELSGTAALIELARVFDSRATKRAIVLVSTSGGSGGSAGAESIPSLIGGPIDAAIVLGDVAGTKQRAPLVIPYSDGVGSAPVLLQRTVAGSISAQLSQTVGQPSVLGQLAHLAFPLAAGEQGVLAGQGIPAVTVQLSGERGPSPTTPVSASVLNAVGRGVLGAVDALEGAPDIAPAPETGLVLQRKTIPAWALDVLLATLLFPVLLTCVDGLARARRRRLAPARWMLWTLSCAVPFALTAALTAAFERTGIIGAAPKGALVHGAMPVTTGAAAALAALLLTFALAWAAWSQLVGRIGLSWRPDDQVAGLSALLVLSGLCIVVLLRSPMTALLLLPALHLWLLIASPELRPRRALATLLIALGLAPLALLIAFYARGLGLSPAEVAWDGVLLVAGGQISTAAVAMWCVALGCVGACSIVAVASPGHAQPVSGDGESRVTIRGPLSYAGPGSLGGTESALRR